jgi:serine/threonine protein kinase/signal transduction histidine kinase/Tfp pilus assembly protein PilF
MALIGLHFNTLEKIGEGSFGTIYKVEDTRTKENFAIKVFDKVPLEEIKEHLLPEMIYKITGLSHENLVKVYDYGIYNEHLYALMEYFGGKSLRDFRLGYENRDEFLEIIIQICYALRYLHENNILHKDLKLENILYTRTDKEIKVKVCDFGFTKIVHLPVGEEDIVTLPYLAPEVLRNSLFSPQSDFYSLGIILYYLAVGAFPFSMDEIALMIEKKIPNIMPQFPSRVNPAVSRNTEELIFKLIEFNPMLRFQTAEEIIQFINKMHKTSFPISIKPSPIENIRSKPLKVHEKSVLTLNDYVEIAVERNGQIVFITGDYGVGKNSSIRFLKWYLISKDYSVFYYRCNESHQDPIFMLCKELITMQDKRGKEKFISEGSEKIQEFLFHSEEKSLELPEEEKSLAADFLLAKNYIYESAKRKPIIYFISDIEMARQSTIEFLQFLEEDIQKYPILIVATTSEAWLANKIRSAVKIRLEPLSKEETHSYIEELLETEVPGEFAKKIYLFTNGNQTFIREILIELVGKNIISFQNNKWNFPSKEELITAVGKIEPPALIKKVINKKIKNIPEGIYRYLERLAVANVPLSNPLIMYLLDLTSSKEVFFILTQCEDLELLVRDPEFAEEGYYKFSYPLLRNILASGVPRKEKVAIEKKIIKYFQDKKISREEILDGIIEHCLDVKDNANFIYFQMRKAYLRYKDKKLLEAWEAADLALDRLKSIVQQQTREKSKTKSSALKLLNVNLPECLLFCMRVGFILEKCKKSLEFYSQYKKLQSLDLIEAPEKDLELQLYYILHLLKCAQGGEAEKEIKHLAKQDFEDKQNIINLCWLTWSVFSDRRNKAIQYLNKLQTEPLSSRHQLWYLYMQAKYYFSTGGYRQAVQTLKNAEKLVLRDVDTDIPKPIWLGRIYNFLADVYNIQNLLDKAGEYYADAREISQKEGELITLAEALTNEGLLLLKKGELENSTSLFEEALENFNRLQYSKGIAEVSLNLAQAYYKLGAFRESDMHFKKALQVAKKIKLEKLIEEILSRYSSLKFKIEPPARFLSFLKKNFSYFLEQGEIREINAFLKNYVLYLHEIGKDEKIEEILEYLEENRIDCSLEREFLLQARGYLRAKQGNIKSALALFRMAAYAAKKNQNEYALMIHYFNLAETYIKKGDLKQARINCELASGLANKNRFARWQNLARIIESRIELLDPEINIRVILRKLLDAEKIAKEMKDWSLLCQSRFLITFIYRALRTPTQEKRYRKKYIDTVNRTIKGLTAEYKESFKQKFGYNYRSIKSRYPDFITPRKYPSAAYLQKRFFDLLQLQRVEQVKSSIKKYILEILGIERFGIILPKNQKEGEKLWFASNITEDVLEGNHKMHLEKANEKKVPQYYTENPMHYCITPLVIKNEVIGMIIFADGGELPFTTQEKRIIELSSFYLTVILKKIGEYQEIMEQREHLSRLLTISRDILQVMDLSELENKIVYHALELTDAERGFFITLDKNKNFVFSVALHRTGEKINEQNLKISKSVLKEVYSQKKVVTTIDAMDEPLLSDSESIEIYGIHSIYCAPLKVKNELFGFLYLDNLGSSQKVLQFDQKVMELFLLECETAIKNCLDYIELYNANADLVKLDEQRLNFINMVSHEFRTPIQTLIGYINILKDENISPEIKEKTLKIMERNLNRLTFAIKNMMQISAIENQGEQIVKKEIDVEEILKIAYEETKPFADERKQKFILEVEKGLPPIYAEHNSLINAIKNLIFNAIKFTDNYGEIILGARNSQFTNEEIDNKPTVVIYVTDNGIGIPSYELENIFKEFYEVADIKSHHSGLSEYLSSGLGLGLPLTKSIVELFEGKIWVESTRGEGSTFFIALPLAESQAQEQESDSAK